MIFIACFATKFNFRICALCAFVANCWCVTIYNENVHFYLLFCVIYYLVHGKLKWVDMRTLNFQIKNVHRKMRRQKSCGQNVWMYK